MSGAIPFKTEFHSEDPFQEVNYLPSVEDRKGIPPPAQEGQLAESHRQPVTVLVLKWCHILISLEF